MTGTAQKTTECQNCGESANRHFPYNAKLFRKNISNIENGEILVCESCRDYFERRKAYSENVLTSKSDKRLIVAGPGTGKTYTFQEVLKTIPRGQKAIVFTLINNLANDLREDLSTLENDLIKVSTFHGFCRELLHSKIGLQDITKDFRYFPLLPFLIEQDALILDFEFGRPDFHASFANLNQNAAQEFYLSRASYYNSASHDDAVYRVFKYYERNQNRIPSFGIVIADEYQDFNRLESSFISLLTNRNKALIAGDDDQALYGFRHASKDYIRQLYSDATYEILELPFCSRCTPAIVEATNYFVKAAQGLGLLDKRIPREFECYLPDKHREHKAYPEIEVAHCSRPETSFKYIKDRIVDLTASENLTSYAGKDIPFLIMGAESGYRIKKVAEYLQENLDEEIYSIETPEERDQLEIEHGYKILHKGVNTNLGWRIVMHFDPPEDIKSIISKTYESDIAIEEMLTQEYITRHGDEIRTLFENQEKPVKTEESEAEPNKIRIRLTNFYGSKGLSALHTFIIDLNNYSFPANPDVITDDEICKFLVALTRAKNSCTLVVFKVFDKTIGKTVDRPSRFIEMLPAHILRHKYFKVQKGNLVEKG
ncbi:MAG: UvrD-helicase domain-containing protein [Thermodesulfobacteriota bacterium]